MPGRARSLAILLAFILLGASASRIARRAFDEAPVRAFEDACLESPCLLEGVLDLEPERDAFPARDDEGRSASLILSVDHVRVGQVKVASRGTVRLTCPEGRHSAERLDPLDAGDRVETWARLRTPRGFLNPGSFDVAAHYARHGFALAGSVKSALVVERIAAAPRHSLAMWGSRVRRLVRQRIASAFAGLPGADEAPGVLLAMLVGDRSWIPVPAAELYQEAGTFHVIAISGAHVALLALLLYKALRKLGIGEAATLWTLLGVLPAYGFICGSAPSVVRAVFMGVGLVTARLLSLEAPAPNVLAVSALALLVMRPLDLEDPGFQLSFAATASLLGFTPWLSTLVAPLGRLGQLVAVSVAAQAGVLPILAWHFQRLSLGALLANVVAVPAAAALLVGGAALVLLEPVPFVGAAVTHVVLWLVKLLTLSSKAALLVPGGTLRVLTPTIFWMVSYFIALGVGLGSRGRLRSVAFASLALWTVALVLKPEKPAPVDLTLSAMDVGHGDALLLEVPGGRRILVDGGGSYDPAFDVGEKVVVPFLLRLGIRRLDAVVLTHPDRDHLGGLPAVVANLRVGEIWEGRPQWGLAAYRELRSRAKARGVRIRRLHDGERLEFGEARLEVLSAPDDALPRSRGGSANAASLVLRVVWGESAMLLTGDAEAVVERKLLVSGRTLRADVLKVGHHGSRSSSSPLFLDAVGPRVALLSVGVARSLGLPSVRVVARLRGRGIEVYRTDRDGAVTIAMDRNGRYRVTTFRRDAPWLPATAPPSPRARSPGIPGRLP